MRPPARRWSAAEALFATRSLTRPELEQARAAVAAIDAKTDGGQAVVREAELAREDSYLRAPLTGQVLKRLVEVGSLVGPGSGGFVLADMRTAKVVIGVPDTMLARFRTGARQRVVSEALPDRTLHRPGHQGVAYGRPPQPHVRGGVDAAQRRWRAQAGHGGHRAGRRRWRRRAHREC